VKPLIRRYIFTENERKLSNSAEDRLGDVTSNSYQKSFKAHRGGKVVQKFVTHSRILVRDQLFSQLCERARLFRGSPLTAHFGGFSHSRPQLLFYATSVAEI
jgi:hypothetical protein